MLLTMMMMMMDGKAREREREFFVWSNSENIKNIIHFYRHFCGYIFFCIHK